MTKIKTIHDFIYFSKTIFFTGSLFIIQKKCHSHQVFSTIKQKPANTFKSPINKGFPIKKATPFVSL